MPDYSVTPAQQQSFLATIKPLCIAAAQRTGCPASILGAQAILESFWGLGDEVPARANNLFGQKDLGGDPYRIGVESFPTTEYDAQNRPYTVTDPFNLYPSWQASIDAHADYITGRLDGYSQQRYLDPKMPTDPAAFARWLVTSPRQYATDSTYPTSLMGLVGKWGLRDWDTPTKGWWQPNPGTSITCMLGADAAKAVTPATDAHIVDLDALTPALVAAQHAAGKRIIAYLSAGTAEDYRADVKAFPASALGKRMSEWPEERWLDVRQPGVLTVIKARIDRAAALGVDGIDPDNVDGYDNAADAGIVLSKADCATYVQAIAAFAHSKGLACGLKNAIDLIGSVSVDYYINEQAGEYGEADAYATVVKSKPVLCIEYSRKGYDAPHPAGMQVSLYASNQALDAPPIAVKGPPTTPPPVTTPAASWDALDRLVGLTPREKKAWGAQNAAVAKSDLTVTFPKGSASPTVARDEGAPVGGCQRLWQISPTDAVTLSYTAELPTDFDPVKGGKLGYGLWGGQRFDGGKRPDGTDGLSVRIMWRKGDQGTVGEAYVYAAECPPGAIDTGKGFSLGRGFPLPVGRPFRVAITARLNEPSRASGSLLVQIDGQTVVAATGIRWRTVDRLKIEGVILSTFFGGGDASWATPRDQTIRYSAPTISTPAASAPPKEDPVIRDTLADIIDRATAANIGYDQSQRKTWYTDAGGITPGASEADCSSLSAGCWRLAGIPINRDSWTGSMVEDARKVGAAITDIAGWSVDQIKARMKVGDLILGPGHVVIVTRDGLVLSADGDENGRASGGKAGDQTGREVYVRDLYARTKGWTHLIAPPGAITSASGFSGVLDVGDQGDAVKRLQSALIAHYSWAASILNPAGGADGQYGAATAKAVAEYQRRIGTTPDGEWGPKTNAASIKTEGWGL